MTEIRAEIPAAATIFAFHKTNNQFRRGKFSLNCKILHSTLIIFDSKGLFTWRWGTPGRWDNPPSRGRKIKRVYIQSYNPGMLGLVFLRLLLRLQLRSFSRSVPRSHLEKDERHMYLFMKASRVVLRGVWLCKEPLTWYVIRNSLGNQIWSIYNAKYSEMWTFYTPCVSVAVSGDFCHETARKCTKF